MRAMVNHWKLSRLVPAVLALALFAAGCGNGDPEDTAGGAPADGDEASVEPIALNYAGALGPEHPGQRMMEWWVDRVNEYSDIPVEVEIFYSGGLIPFPEIIPGVGDGRADLGYAAPLYNPAEMPLNTIAEVPFLVENLEAQMRAADEFYETSEPFRQEYTDMGVEMLLLFPTGEAVIGSKEPLETIADVQGKQIRSWGRIAEAINQAGGNGIAIEFNEIYESVERGLLDAHVNTVGAIHSSGLYEITPYVYDPGFGAALTLQPLVINKERWDSFPQTVRDAMEQATADYWDEAFNMLEEMEGQACTEMLEAGAQFAIWSEGEQQGWQEIVGDQYSEEWVANMEEQGLPGRAFFDEYTSLVDKYEAEATFLPTAQACAQQTGQAS